MPYEILATRKTPALIIHLLDVSGSMGEKLGQPSPKTDSGQLLSAQVVPT